jgi:hypothetical protein
MNQGPGPNANAYQNLVNAGVQQASQGQQMDFQSMLQNPGIQQMLAGLFLG